jgi:hypothetical protein
MSRTGIVAAIVVFFLVVGLVAAVKVSVWIECRQSNSWLYCFNLMTR